MRLMITEPRYLPSLMFLNRLSNVDKVIIIDRSPGKFEYEGFLNYKSIKFNLHIPIVSEYYNEMQPLKFKPIWVNDHIKVIKDCFYDYKFFDPSFFISYLQFIPGHYPDQVSNTLINLINLFKINVNVEFQSNHFRAKGYKNDELVYRICESENATELLVGKTNYVESGFSSYLLENLGCQVLVHKPELETIPSYRGRNFIEPLFKYGKNQIEWVIKSEIEPEALIKI